MRSWATLATYMWLCFFSPVYVSTNRPIFELKRQVACLRCSLPSTHESAEREDRDDHLWDVAPLEQVRSLENFFVGHSVFLGGFLESTEEERDEANLRRCREERLITQRLAAVPLPSPVREKLIEDSGLEGMQQQKNNEPIQIQYKTKL